MLRWGHADRREDLDRQDHHPLDTVDPPHFRHLREDKTITLDTIDKH